MQRPMSAPEIRAALVYYGISDMEVDRVSHDLHRRKLVTKPVNKKTVYRLRDDGADTRTMTSFVIGRSIAEILRRREEQVRFIAPTTLAASIAQAAA